MCSRVVGPTVAFSLPDGRRVVVRWWCPHRPVGVLLAAGLLAVAIAVGAYPVVRHTTRRLERLHARVEALGAGDLTARVEVEGCDEGANLARSFNYAADRIERLVNAQRTMLAGASPPAPTAAAMVWQKSLRFMVTSWNVPSASLLTGLVPGHNQGRPLQVQR
jgi:hypothetical protein